MEKSVLVEMLVEDMSSQFLKRFEGRMPTSWNEAVGRSVNDPHIDPALERYALGQARYFLVQSMFIEVGKQCGYQTRIDLCEQNNYPIPVVIIGRFIVTAHYAFSASEKFVLNSSFTRKQHSAINNAYVLKNQGNLFEPAFDEKKIRDAKEVRANVLFGCAGSGLDFQNYGFLRIAFPSVETVSDRVLLVENHKYQDVLSLVSEKERKAKRQAKPMIDVAKPTLKSVVIKS